MKLVGPDALPPRERAFLESARLIREGFLQQSAFHEVDTYCPGKKQYEMLRIMSKFSDRIQEAVGKGVRTLDEMKWRVRTGMGRCQGGFCTSRVLKIMSEELGVSPLEIKQKGGNSYILDHETKAPAEGR